MNRLGVRLEGVSELLDEILTRGLALKGVYSHFASADLPDLQDATLQLERFEKIQQTLFNTLQPKPLFHLSNSAGVMAFGRRAAFDLIRPGIASYGYAPDPSMACGPRSATRSPPTSRLGTETATPEGPPVKPLCE